MRTLSLSVFLALSSILTFGQTATPVTTTHFPATPVPGTKPGGPSKAMALVAPLFVQNDQISSSIALVNNTAQTAGATITIRNLDGAVVAQRHIVLEQNGKQELALTDLLSTATVYTNVGSISVLQDAKLVGQAVNAQLLLKDLRNAVLRYVDEEFFMPSAEGSSFVRGVSDSADGRPLLAITNSAEKVQAVTVSCLTGKARVNTAKIVIPSHGTSLTVGCSQTLIKGFDSYLQSLRKHDNPEPTGYEVVGDGSPGTLAAFAFAPHAIQGNEFIFSGVPLSDPKLQVSSSAVYPGVPFGT